MTSLNYKNYSNFALISKIVILQINKNFLQNYADCFKIFDISFLCIDDADELFDAYADPA